MIIQLRYENKMGGVLVWGNIMARQMKGVWFGIDE